MHTTRPLQRILGVGFALAIAFGGTVGFGILRLPGTLAASLGDARLIIAFWIVGGMYALLGAVAVSELAAMVPETGGFYVYARRAFGDGIGFAVGWSDWLNNVAAIALQSVTAALFLGSLWPPAAAHPTLAAFAILSSLTALHWIGLRVGDSLTRLVSLAVATTFVALIVGCFLVAAPPFAVPPPSKAAAISLPLLSLGMLTATVTALRAVLQSYDGWYSPIYTAGETTNPARALPRGIIGGALLVAALYVLVNLAFLRLLPLPVLAASELPAADAARVLLPHGGAEFVTVVSLLTVLSVLNATVLGTPRILLAIAQHGLFFREAARISASGTPRVALAGSALVAGALVLSGTFEQLIAIAAVVYLLTYLSAYVAVFVLRRREPATPRPYQAFGFPVTTAVVALGTVIFLVAAIVEDPRAAAASAVLLLACWPIYIWVARRRSRRPPSDPSEATLAP